ncbi:MAG: hypothetical protein OEW80_01095 [Gemmatimonadota bacterium]|nr:hypothetical protein [Gemmatimonadota bacterium]
MKRWIAVCVAIGCLGACRGERQPDVPAKQPPPPPPPPADSLALTMPAGIEIWFTASRAAVSAHGVPCVERVMEIREGASRRVIPLLYTGAPPRLVNDTTIEADIWLNCRPGNVYQVSVRTGRPVRVR